MVYQRLVPIPAHRLNRRSSNGRAPQQDSLATEQRLTQLERDNTTLVAASRRDNRLSHFIGLGALVVAAASAWGGYQFNTWQQNNAAELAAAQNAQEMRQATQEAQSYRALLSMACVLQSQQAFAELQYRPQAAIQIFDALNAHEAKCQSVGVSLTARAAWLLTKNPNRIDRKIVRLAQQKLQMPTEQQRLALRRQLVDSISAALADAVRNENTKPDATTSILTGIDLQSLEKTEELPNAGEKKQGRTAAEADRALGI
jgi:hypothetical protein